MTRRQRARLTRGAQYAVGIIIILFLVLKTDWSQFADAFLRLDIVARMWPSVITTGLKTDRTAGLAAGVDPSQRSPEAGKVAIRAYEDGSANLYCDGRQKPFGAIDAESGKVRFFIPR